MMTTMKTGRSHGRSSKAACSFAVSQRLLIAVGDALMLTTVGAAAG
jgi:hypothetical protein